MGLEDIEKSDWPASYEGRFEGAGGVFLEEEYGADVLQAMVHKGDLAANARKLEEKLSELSEGAPFLLVVDGNLKVDGILDCSGNDCLAVTGDLHCDHLYGDSYSYVSVGGDLIVDGAVLTEMMSDCGFVVNGETRAKFVGMARHAMHEFNPSADTIVLHEVDDHIVDKWSGRYLRRDFIDALESDEKVFTESLETLREAGD